MVSHPGLLLLRPCLRLQHRQRESWAPVQGWALRAVAPGRRHVAQQWKASCPVESSLVESCQEECWGQRLRLHLRPLPGQCLLPPLGARAQHR